MAHDDDDHHHHLVAVTSCSGRESCASRNRSRGEVVMVAEVAVAPFSGDLVISG